MAASAPSSAPIHSGYNSEIYSAAGERYSDLVTTTIDSASIANNVLDIKFSATGSAADLGLAAKDIVPTVLVGLYGYDTHNFVVSPHNSDITEADGTKSRNLEYVVGATHPRFTTVAAADGSWEVTADISAWADKIADGSVKRLEIAVMPKLGKVVGEVDSRENGETDDLVLALNAPSKTFNIADNAFEEYFNPIVKVADGCNKCHDALGTTFHSGDRGGNIVVCRLCHTVNNGASHLEMQGRSIDSYVHAIHSMQPLDPQNLTKEEFEEEVGFVYPTFTTTACESCHNAGTYNVPDQAKSLPGILSASKQLPWDRNIGDVPSYIVGPASRACGGCHRAELINEDKAGDLAAFNEHTGTFGTLVDAATTTLATVTDQIMSMFK